jgi:hypothetical protein
LRIPIVRGALLALGLAVVAAPARADGVYVDESFGVATPHGKLASVMGDPLYLRFGIGMRLGQLAIEPWFLTDLQTSRVGAFRGLIGGDPAPGSADINALGLDVKYIVPLDNHLETYVRGGPLSATANGALAGYAGRGLGVGGGFQLSGQVRALGFLWSPLFFLKRGPLITGALFLDAGYDLMFLRAHGSDPINDRIGHVAVGFALGSAF